MTVTVEKLIQWLQTQPQEAIVEVATVTGHGYGGAEVGYHELQESDLQENGEQVGVVDLRGNPHIKPDQPYYGKVYIQFGNVS